jgi:hypothetical protein
LDFHPPPTGNVGQNKQEVVDTKVIVTSMRPAHPPYLAQYASLLRPTELIPKKAIDCQLNQLSSDVKTDFCVIFVSWVKFAANVIIMDHANHNLFFNQRLRPIVEHEYEQKSVTYLDIVFPIGVDANTVGRDVLYRTVENKPIFAMIR